jgi:glyoxylase-like metal-dependent hydrolase (beta-lactamase superfamily II)
MKVNDELYVLELPMNFAGAEMIMNLSLISDAEHGLTLVDAALPGQADLIEAAIAKEGLSASDITQIVLTHQDMDHIGSLNVLQKRTNAQVIAHMVEIPYIEGIERSPKYPSAERLAANPGLAELLSNIERSKVDVAVNDGEELTKSAGAVVIPTPGHTFGHISLYLPRTKTLIAGDALVAEAGKLQGPMPMATPDMETAMLSVKRLAELEIDTIVCYHGGLVTDDANGQLRALVN